MPIIGPLTGGPGTLATTGVKGDIYKSTASVSGNLAGDATGATTANIVVSISGETGTVAVGTAGNIIQWNAGTTNPMLTQASATSLVATQNMTIISQAPYSGATGTNAYPGNLTLSTPAIISGATGLGQVILQADGYSIWTFGNGGNQFGVAAVNIGTGTVTTGIIGGATHWVQNLTPDQYCRPYIKLVGTSPAAMYLVFPPIDGAMWILDGWSVANAHTNGINAASNGIANNTAEIGFFTSEVFTLLYDGVRGKLVATALTF